MNVLTFVLKMNFYCIYVVLALFLLKKLQLISFTVLIFGEKGSKRHENRNRIANDVRLHVRNPKNTTTEF